MSRRPLKFQDYAEHTRAKLFKKAFDRKVTSLSGEEPAAIETGDNNEFHVSKFIILKKKFM